MGWLAILPALIGAGSSAAGQIIGGAIAGNASKDAAQLGYQTGQNQLNALVNMYGLERGDRAPIRAVGLSALDTLQHWKPGGDNALKPVDLSQYKPNTIDLPPALGALTKPGTNPFSPPDYAGTSTAGVNSFANKFHLPSFFGGNNPDKNFASNTVNQLSNWTWNTLMPAVKSGQVTPDQALQSFNQAWSTWENTLRSTPGMDSGVIERSISSQRQYFQPFFTEIDKLRQGQQQPAAGA